MSRIIDFYKYKGTDNQGRTLHDILAFSNKEMEKVHDYIQWLFPLPEPSRAQPQSPVLTEEDLNTFRKDPLIRKTVRFSIHKYLTFLEETDAWHRMYDHNHLRITRVIRFLTLIDMPNEARGIYEFASDGAEFGFKTLWYWAEALKEKPAWLVSCELDAWPDE